MAVNSTLTSQVATANPNAWVKAYVATCAVWLVLLSSVSLFASSNLSAESRAIGGALKVENIDGIDYVHLNPSQFVRSLPYFGDWRRFLAKRNAGAAFTEGERTGFATHTSYPDRRHTPVHTVRMGIGKRGRQVLSTAQAQFANVYHTIDAKGYHADVRIPCLACGSEWEMLKLHRGAIGCLIRVEEESDVQNDATGRFVEVKWKPMPVSHTGLLCGACYEQYNAEVLKVNAENTANMRAYAAALKLWSIENEISRLKRLAERHGATVARTNRPTCDKHPSMGGFCSCNSHLFRATSPTIVDPDMPTEPSMKTPWLDVTEPIMTMRDAARKAQA